VTDASAHGPIINRAVAICPSARPRPWRSWSWPRRVRSKCVTTQRFPCGVLPNAAGVAAATAYNYFSSKDHILAEVLWRRMQSAPHLVDLSRPLPERVAETVRTMGFGTADSPGVVDACTTALLGDGPDVKQVRARIGGEIYRRLDAALGPDADPSVLRILQITYTGAILSAGMGHLRFADVPDLLAEAATLLSGEKP